MEYPALKGKVIKIKEGAGYEGKVYDQCVFIELANRKVVDLFDYDMLVHPDILDKVMDVTIDVFIPGIEKLAEPKYGVEPALTREGDYKKTGYGHVFFGQIKDVGRVNHKLILDIGIGDIFASPGCENLNDFQVGEFVRVFSTRSDLYHVQE
ncbi:hypothetical protein MSLAZ_0198 [Methanosarcina lacustris Z-7289]|uniref:Uncharacterized protein n=1 Tax=Methanosarcina lacustris Z-7289 TaxID=1434111 RepID=A0A0E3RYX8_9EURY|nr:hypothetical protein [Methanosarcina lacustris]AKB73459.1 hypothetical protein MSLAZ_0198 [Methanosarcina lacustris Z-7289]